MILITINDPYSDLVFITLHLDITRKKQYIKPWLKYTEMYYSNLHKGRKYKVLSQKILTTIKKKLQTM